MKELIMRALEKHRGRMLMEAEVEGRDWISYESVADAILEILAPALVGAADQVLTQLEGESYA